MGIKRNFAYNIILTLSTYVANLVVFPYVTRVLGVEQFGLVGFASQTVNFFILFAMLGIGTVGIREIAACGDNRQQRNRVFSSLVSVSVITTLIASAAYVAMIFAVPKMRCNSTLMLVGVSQLLFNTLLIEWFYRGIENFRYISIRSIAVRVLYVIAVFALVRRAEDYIVYFALTCAVVVVNALINMLYARRFVNFSLRNISLREYLTPLWRIGSYSIITAMYTTFNVMYLGLVNTDTEVGYYFTASKIYIIILGIYTAFSNVMLPRMSLLAAQSDGEAFRRNLHLSLDILLAFAFPVVVFCTAMAPQLIRLLSGAGYEGAVVPMQMIMVLILIVGICQIIVMQVLLPLHKDATVLRASLIGAAVGIGCNVAVVGRYGAIGSAVVLLCSETAVFMFYTIYTARKGLFRLPWFTILRHAVAAVPYIGACLLCRLLPIAGAWQIAAAAALCGMWFAVLQLYIMRLEILRHMLKLK